MKMIIKSRRSQAATVYNIFDGDFIYTFLADNFKNESEINSLVFRLCIKNPFMFLKNYITTKDFMIKYL